MNRGQIKPCILILHLTVILPVPWKHLLNKTNWKTGRTCTVVMQTREHLIPPAEERDVNRVRQMFRKLNNYLCSVKKKQKNSKRIKEMHLPQEMRIIFIKSAWFTFWLVGFQLAMTQDKPHGRCCLFRQPTNFQWYIWLFSSVCSIISAFYGLTAFVPSRPSGSDSCY